MANTKFYLYNQNNSGGFYSPPAQNIIVEADNAERADYLAQTAGVYFDPDFEIDCDCCGSRWYPQSGWDNEGEDNLLDVRAYVFDWYDEKDVADVIVVTPDARILQAKIVDKRVYLV